jgi:hypothetical protein
MTYLFTKDSLKRQEANGILVDLNESEMNLLAAHRNKIFNAEIRDAHNYIVYYDELTGLVTGHQFKEGQNVPDHSFSFNVNA